MLYHEKTAFNFSYELLLMLKKGMSRLKMRLIFLADRSNSNKSSLINIIITYLDSIRYLKVTN